MATTIDRIFTLLSDNAFKNPNTGLLFFPAYIYTYAPQDEYHIRKQIEILNSQLKRPTNSLNCLVINIYEEFIKFLKNNSFAGESLFDQIMQLEVDDALEASEFIKEKAQDEEFIDYLGELFSNYFKDKTSDKIYLIIHGFGSIFPYLRVSHFLKNTEKYIKNYKLILFYPGEFKNANYSLFGHFNDDNLYRANHLNQLL